jgi:hypothetical protein
VLERLRGGWLSVELPEGLHGFVRSEQTTRERAQSQASSRQGNELVLSLMLGLLVFLVFLAIQAQTQTGWVPPEHISRLLGW